MIFLLLLLATLAANFGIGVPLDIDIIGLSASIEFTDDVPSRASLFRQLVKIPLTLFFAWPYAATSIKRLHDRSRSGWWMIPFIGASGLYGQFGGWLGGSWAAALIGLAVFVAFIWGLVEMCFMRGTRGPNRFGPDPLAPIDTGPSWDQQSELQFVPHRGGPLAGA